jgi:hypothetical protein
MSSSATDATGIGTCTAVIGLPTGDVDGNFWSIDWRP